jgi:glutathione synthase
VSVLVVTDPLDGLDPQVDATIGLAAAAIDLGACVWVCGPEQLSVHDGRVQARASRLTLAPRGRAGDHRWRVPRTWFALGPPRNLDVAAEVDLVLLRIDPPVDGRYLRTTYLLDLVELAGTRVVNRPEGVRALHEKAIALHVPELSPPTVVTADAVAVRRFVRATGAAVVKPFDGFAGHDVWLLHDDASCTALAESATRGGTRHVIVQPYLAGVAEGNKRLFVLDGEIIEAVTRRPAADDFRIGPPVARAEVDAHDRAIARALAPLLRRHGIALAGIDVIAGLLIEVNVTCPGGMAKTDALLGTDLSGVIVRRLLHQCAPDRSSPEKEEVPA